MHKKIGKKIGLTKETLRRLDDRTLGTVAGGASLLCSTASQPKCSGCETCPDYTG